MFMCFVCTDRVWKVSCHYVAHEHARARTYTHTQRFKILGSRPKAWDNLTSKTTCLWRLVFVPGAKTFCSVLCSCVYLRAPSPYKKTLTLKRQIQHMIKHKYVPWNWGKAKYKGSNGRAAGKGKDSK